MRKVKYIGTEVGDECIYGNVYDVLDNIKHTIPDEESIFVINEKGEVKEYLNGIWFKDVTSEYRNSIINDILL